MYVLWLLDSTNYDVKQIKFQKIDNSAISNVKPRRLASLVLLRLRYYVIARSVAQVALYMRTRINEHDRPSREYNDFWDHMKSSTRGQRIDLECFQLSCQYRSISF